MPNIKEFGKLVDENLKLIRNTSESSILNINLDRFSNGEGKATLTDSVRGQNVLFSSLRALYEDVTQRTNNGVQVLFKLS